MAALSQRMSAAWRGVAAMRRPAAPFFARVRRFGSLWLRSWGRQGALALAALLLCAAFVAVAVLPAREQRDAARAKVLALRMRAAVPHAAAGRAPDTPAEQLAAFYKRFPTQRSLPDALETLVAVAERHGVGLDEGDYKISRDNVGKLVRVQMTLPLTGSYPQIRRFLSALPEELPVLALENVQFDRQKISDPAVEVKIRVILFLERT